MPGSIFLHGFYKGGLPLVFRGRAQTKIIYFWKGPDMDRTAEYIQFGPSFGDLHAWDDYLILLG